ncbi:HAD-like protein [Obba rivulosa]|uniref:HAD-like protein n=1 Tax=Obba rivulosa TaxID=1052685 RepID=A0A8E2J358_9APHY|nr:HAD-like protein [Obba rivulosa]
MSAAVRYTTLILDLGDVLFTWSPKTKTSISPRILKEILNSATWYEYERGSITQHECYERVGVEFGIAPSEIHNAFKQARDSMESNDELIALVRELKEQSDGELLVFALSNISLPDYEYVLTKPADWSIFDKVFPSALVGERKPHLGIYKHVIAETGVDPRTTVFVDDKIDNVLSARSLGMHGIVFDKHEDVMRALRNIFGDPVRRGREYLRRNARKLESITDHGVAFGENFTQLLILELTSDASLVTLPDRPRTWNFFRGKPLFSEAFPDDLDTTSLALTVLKRDAATVSSVMDEMLKYRDADGIMQTYFDNGRQRLDPFVNANVLTLFYANGRGHELDQSLSWVREVLLYRAYLGGSRYYPSADCFLYFISRLFACTSDPVLHHQLKPLFVERVHERIGVQGDALELAFRLLVCASFNISNQPDMRKLLEMQCQDGGWDGGNLYRFGTTGLKVTNRGLTTAAAVQAIEATQLRPPSPAFSVESPKSPVTPVTPMLEIPALGLSISRPSSPLLGYFKLPWKKSAEVH